MYIKDVYLERVPTVNYLEYGNKITWVGNKALIKLSKRQTKDFTVNKKPEEPDAIRSQFEYILY